MPPSSCGISFKSIPSLDRPASLRGFESCMLFLKHHPENVGIRYLPHTNIVMGKYLSLTGKHCLGTYALSGGSYGTRFPGERTF